MESSWFDRDSKELIRKFRLENGNAVQFVKGYPKGLWYIKFENGTTPTDLAGQFTSYNRAFTHFQKVLAQRARPNLITQEEEVPKEEAINATFSRNSSRKQLREGADLRGDRA